MSTPTTDGRTWVYTGPEQRIDIQTHGAGTLRPGALVTVTRRSGRQLFVRTETGDVAWPVSADQLIPTLADAEFEAAGLQLAADGSTVVDKPALAELAREELRRTPGWTDGATTDDEALEALAYAQGQETAEEGELIAGRLVRDTELAPNAVEHARMVEGMSRSWFTAAEDEAWAGEQALRYHTARAVAAERRRLVEEITGRLTTDGQPLRGVEAWVLGVIAEAGQDPRSAGFSPEDAAALAASDDWMATPEQLEAGREARSALEPDR